MISLGFILASMWNLFLAAMPVALSFALAAALGRRSAGRTGRLGVMALGLVWLVVLPNSCYLLTEWRHFLFNRHFQAARDLDNPSQFSVVRASRHFAFYAAYSGFGMACFAISVRRVQSACRSAGLKTTPLAVPFFFVVSLGVFLGLVIRLNSWDLLVRPAEVVLVAARSLARPRLLAMVSGFGVFLWISYTAIDIWFDGLAVRFPFASCRIHSRTGRFRLVAR